MGYFPPPSGEDVLKSLFSGKEGKAVLEYFLAPEDGLGRHQVLRYLIVKESQRIERGKSWRRKHGYE